MPARGLKVGVAFGGRSVEHDVSIITGLQALAVLEDRHAPVPIYISRTGRWFTGDALRDLSAYQAARDGNGPAGGGRGAGGGQRTSGGDPDSEEVHFDLHNGRLLRAGGEGGGSFLRRRSSGARAGQSIDLDVVVLATHGTQGEDGCLSGALELARLPYVGPPVGAAAAAMDKVATKAILSQAGLPALGHLAFLREQWEHDGASIAVEARERLSLPLYVKPASLGSSVGVSRCTSEEEIVQALELVFELDRVCLIEPAVEGGIEVNCAVIGRPGVEPRASVCEQPIAAESFLSFEDKYMGSAKGEGGASQGMKGAQRLIPAPIDASLTEQVQELAKRAFTAFGCAGVTRVDFLIDADGRPYVNELNTVPGSFSFYLWEPAGLPFADLMDELIDLALAERRETERTTRVFDTSLLALRASGAKVGEKG